LPLATELKFKMLVIFQSILPIFLLIMAGFAMRQLRLMDDAGWRGIDQLSFYVLYPVLLFVTITKADFNGMAIGGTLGVLTFGWIIVGAIIWAAAPFLIKRGLVAHSQYSSVFQSTIRWNGFVALAVSDRLLGPQSSAIIALVMAGLVLPVNVVAIYVVTKYAAGPAANLLTVAKRMAANPIVLACVASLLWKATGLELYEPLLTALTLTSSGALAIGLFGIGAGLTVKALSTIDTAHVLPVLLKLLVLPAIAFASVLITGQGAAFLSAIVLCAAVPTAMNGYVVARQLGGDAPLYAAIVTTQTLLSFLTIPLWLAASGAG
jgi:malonate transporter and related proteins